MYYLDEALMAFIAGEGESFYVDYAALWGRVARIFDISYGVNVVRVDRDGSDVRIVYRQRGTEQLMVKRCDKLIVAFQPTIENLKAFNLSE